ncbi:hypothetical protein ACFRQM_09440 [Streptomyces sp. NPDC056831]|uniref:hypothetical protein n=1 Tax=Streptomyces sp. NPDC056831 TaxID=3345954 RepID=UPI0036A47822
MSELATRIAAWVHECLSAAAHRLAAGHTTLVGAVTERPVWWPASPDRADDEKPATDDETPTDDEEPTPAKTSPKKTPKEKTTDKGQEGEAKGKKKPAAPPAHTMYRPGPRRALAAAAHWTADGDGARDFLLRAGLLAAAVGALAYFARPLFAALPPAALSTAAVIVVVYEISPRLSVLLATGLAVALIGPVWLGIGIVVLLAVELAPVLAALLALGLAAAVIHPALMWPVTLGWAVAAWCAGAPEKESEKPVEEPVEEAEPEPLPEPLPEHPRTHLVRWLDRLTRGTSGIHLDQLHAALTAHPDLADLTRPQMRAWLNRHEIAVERTLRVGNIPGRSGIARATIETLLTAPLQTPSEAIPSPVESGVESTPLHASDLHESPHSPDVESGVECPPGALPRAAGTAPGSPETTPTLTDALYT